MSAVSASSPALDPDQLQLLTDDFENQQQHSINLATSALSPIHNTLHPPISTLGPSPPGRSSSPRHHSSRHPVTPSRPGAGSNSSSSRSQRARRSSYWPSSSSPSRLETSNTWGVDEICDASEPVDLIGIPGINSADEQFLDSLVSNEFSSPSSYPQLTAISPHSRTTNAAQSNPSGASSRQLPPLSRQHTTVNPPIRPFTAESRSVTQLSASTTQDSVLSPSTNDIDEGATETADSSFSEAMPTVTRRSNHPTIHQDKKPRMHSPPSSRTQTKHETEEDSLFFKDTDDLFGDDQLINNGDFTTIDLTDANEVPDEFKKPDIDNRVKISSFQCVICMDDVTTLTLTHCGK